MKAVVIGAGVSGLTSAICLQDAGFDVTILARDMPPETTSAVAGAIWHPVSTAGDEEKRAWAAAGLPVLTELAGMPDSGVAPFVVDEPLPNDRDDLSWLEIVADAEPLPADKLPEGYRRGYRYATFLFEPPRYLAYLRKRFLAGGGQLRQEVVTVLSDYLSPDHLLVNCTGAWAGKLTGDDRVYPIRGQVIRLKAQQRVDGVHIDGGPMAFTYIFPRSQDCILGGIYGVDDWSLQPNDSDTASIRERCGLIDADVAAGEAMEVLVGLRPGRDRVRLEREETTAGTLIHNYGHAGLGYTLSWGCAQEVANLAVCWQNEQNRLVEQ